MKVCCGKLTVFYHNLSSIIWNIYKNLFLQKLGRYFDSRKTLEDCPFNAYLSAGTCVVESVRCDVPFTVNGEMHYSCMGKEEGEEQEEGAAARRYFCFSQIGSYSHRYVGSYCTSASHRQVGSHCTSASHR